jgi:hypothetical protein
MEFILCAVVFLVAATGLFFLAAVLGVVFLNGYKPMGLPMVITGLAMSVYVLAHGVRSIPSFKKISSFQSRHLLLAVAWGLSFGFSVALFFAGNIIMFAGKK